MDCDHAFEHIEQHKRSDPYFNDCTHWTEEEGGPCPADAPIHEHESKDLRCNFTFVVKCKKCGETRNLLVAIDPYSMPDEEKDRHQIKVPAR